VPVPVIVDGYNLLYALGEAPAPATRARLVTDLVGWARARGRRVVLVFDAWAGGAREAREESHGPVTVCFTRTGERAEGIDRPGGLGRSGDPAPGPATPRSSERKPAHRAHGT